jgi:hypothetical protein
MGEKEKLMFPDKSVPPTDDLIFSFIGNKKIFWLKIMNFMKDNYQDSQGVWNYYNDGKQWLFKMVLKKKTVFWAAIFDGYFRITFYFGGKAEPVIDASDLPDKIKQGFKTGPRYGNIRSISMIVNDISDVSIIEKIIPIKVRMK